jgi:superfamily II DNA helicase RecQ
MQLKLITLSYDPEIGCFPAEPLHEVEGEIVNVVEHFFQHSGLPRLLLIVHYRHYPPIREPRAAAAVRSSEPGVRAELAEPERELFDRLRAWRNGRAQAEGVPPYVLLTNRQVAAAARLRPQTLTALREIEGIGEAKANRFGRELLAVVAQAVAAVGPAARSEPVDVPAPS